MLHNNPLLTKLKKQLRETTPRVEGIVKAHEKGFGFLELNNKKSYFISVAKMKKLLHGDRVEGTVNVRGDKEQFEPETIIESALTHFVGKIDYLNKHVVVYPYGSLTKQAIRCRISPNVTIKLKPQHWVIAKLVARPFQEDHQSFCAEVTEFIAEEDDILMPWLRTLSQYHLPRTAPKLIELPVMSSHEKQDRKDLNHLRFFSIDSEDTKDIDDALHITLTEDNLFELTVAIADPSAYIPENSQLDRIAKERLFTTYLPDFNVPMLPAEIADNFCSLIPNEQRAAITCQLHIDKEGHLISKPYFTTAWITSKAKLSYDAVSDYIEEKNQAAITDKSITEQLMLLAKVAQIRSNRRQKKALLFKDKDDYKFILDNKRQVVTIIKNQRRIANKIVEEGMIMANHAFANSLKQDEFAIFNIHNGFEAKHLDTIIKILADHNIKEFDKKRLVSFEGYCALLRQLAGDNYIKSRILRYQTAADFTFEAAPHFGLGFERYATWTSPLRKYSDLVNHRLLKAILRKESPLKKPQNSWLKSIVEKRRSQRSAERDLKNYLYNQFLSDKISTLFKAEVIDINKGGAKVRLIDNGAVAFMPISLIHPKRNEIINNQDEGAIRVNGQILFKIADEITVSLHEIRNEPKSIIVKYEADTSIAT